MSQEYLTLTKIAKEVPGRPNAKALWRWCRNGLKARNGERVRLKHMRVGSRIMVCHKDLDAFFKEIRESDLQYFKERDDSVVPDQVIPQRSESQRQRDGAAAHARLAAQGL